MAWPVAAGAEGIATQNSLLVRGGQIVRFFAEKQTHSLRLFAAFWLAIWITTAQAEEPAQAVPKPVFPPPPRLAISAAEWATAKAGSKFEAQQLAATRAAEPLLKSPVVLPTDFGSWIFYYACEKDGATLRPLSATEHECPRCQAKYNDERTVAAYRCQLHHNLEHAALKLGWAYAYTQDARYAAAARRILLHLADAYPKYPLRQDRWGRQGVLALLGGRRYVQSLDEAVGVIRLAKAYDLTRQSDVWSASDHKHVQEDFFRATAQTLLLFNQGINNHQTWYNAGLMAIASVLADAELVQRVLTMRGGYFDQLDRSLGDDGIWYEGAMAYQNYALQAMVEIVDAGRRLGLQLDTHPRFRALLTSSLDAAYPNGQFPAINDSDPGSIRSFQWSYRWAWDRFHEERFAQAAAWGRPQLLAELMGPEAKVRSPLPEDSLNLADNGLAILRAGTGPDQTCVFFDYGEHGAGHGHFDKLNITLFANGREWLLDTGRIGYTHQEYKTWVKHTVAHNTVVVDQADQRGTRGTLNWIQQHDQWTACQGECKTAYTGILLRRQLLLSPRMLLDVFTVESTLRDVQLDWLAHAAADTVQPVEALESSAAALSADPQHGYQHLKDIRQWTVPGPTQWDYLAGKQRLRIWLPAADQEVFTCLGVGSNVAQQTPTLVRRKNGTRSATFVTVYDLGGSGDFVQDVQSEKNPKQAWRIRTADGLWRVRFAEQGAEVNVDSN